MKINIYILILTSRYLFTVRFVSQPGNRIIPKYTNSPTVTVRMAFFWHSESLILLVFLLWLCPRSLFWSAELFANSSSSHSFTVAQPCSLLYASSCQLNEEWLMESTIAFGNGCRYNILVFSFVYITNIAQYCIKLFLALPP
jgi:hypothetical protein